MEYLTFNQGGQWDLHKTFESFSGATAEGRLHEDRGTKGSLHNFGGGKHPKPAGVQGRRHWGKVPHVEDSVYEDNNPGSDT